MNIIFGAQIIDTRIAGHEEFPVLHYYRADADIDDAVVYRQSDVAVLHGKVPYKNI